jgi:Rieske Fe-S protein
MTMHRRQFVKLGCNCMIAPLIAAGLSACESTRYVAGTLGPDGITIQQTEFVEITKSGTTLRDYIIVRNENLEYPICLYRLKENEYSALQMKCTHQGTELQAAGDQLHCPAHGSEFNNRGQVTQGPAEHPLRTFRVVAEQDHLLIELK